jgi:hypothetical protein
VDAEQGTVTLHWQHTGVNAVTGARYGFGGVTWLCVKGGQVCEHRDFFDPAVLINEFKQAHKHKKKQSKL